MTSGSVWGLDTGRPGEFRQVTTLGNVLGLVFERIRLSPEGQLLDALPAAPPLLILSFGSAARSALRLAAGLPRRPLLVHLGTPGQIPGSAFDLIIPMPQDDYPPGPNVLFLHLPLNGASTSAATLPSRAGPGICTVIVGGPSRHFRITAQAVRRLLQCGVALAQGNAEALQVVTSPRTPPDILAELRRLSTAQNFVLHEYGGADFAGILKSASRLLVTGDSASMLAEACRTGAPVWLFALPWRPNFSDFLQHASDRCFGPKFRHLLVRRGWLGGGTDFARWHRRLEQLGFLAAMQRPPAEALRWSPAATRPDTDLLACRDRILALLGTAQF